LKRKVLYVLAAVLAVVVAIGIWQRENIKAFVISRSNTSQQLEEKSEENDKKIDAIIEQDPDLDITKLTDEQREELRTGKMTEKEALSIVLEKTKSDSAAKSNDIAAIELKKQRINELVAEVYVMRDSYVAKLNAIESAGRTKYASLPAEQRTKAAKSEIASECISQASALEGQCDSQMDSILSEMTTLLKETNGDTTLVSRVRGTYAEQKAITKAQYLN
jgi:hypothetical protein